MSGYREALADAIWTASRADEGTISATGANHVAEAVVAAVRAMTPAEQAELLDGHVENEYLPNGTLSDQRVVGPWREA